MTPDGQFYWNDQIDDLIHKEEEYKEWLREQLWGVSPSSEED